MRHVQLLWDGSRLVPRWLNGEHANVIGTTPRGRLIVHLNSALAGMTKLERTIHSTQCVDVPNCRCMDESIIHAVDVHSVGTLYQAQCACGWAGWARSLRRAAERDAVTHAPGRAGVSEPMITRDTDQQLSAPVAAPTPAEEG